MDRVITLSSDGWRLRYYDSINGEKHSLSELEKAKTAFINATVPGNVEIDLALAGLLPADIFKGMSTKLAEEYETYEFIYSTEFETPPVQNGERIILRFDGVDCLADYELNGEIIGSTDNAFMPFEFDVTSRLIKSGLNRLAVRLSSALIYTLGQKYDQFLSHGSHTTGGCFIRKPAHSYGWDIFPRLLTAGIWKDVSLLIRPAARIDEVTYRTKELGFGERELEFTVNVSAPTEYFLDNNKLRVTALGRCGSSEFFAEHGLWRRNAVRFTVMPNDIKLWWPYGYGEPNLYETVFELRSGDEIIDTFTLNVGIRTAKLIRSESLDEENPEFVFEINGVKVMSKGSNWVPLDALHSRDKSRYQRAMELVSECGCNILRVWGGGVYEQEYFYDYCDKHGIMVWQDFMMACQVIPTDEKMLRNITDEFTWAIKALRNHSSVVLWSGDNENDEGLCHHGINPDSNFVTRELIPDLLIHHDPYREYLPSSPYINSENFAKLQRGRDVLPENHLWGPRDYYKASFYRDSRARFVSETGYHGCPSPSSIKKMFDDSAVWPYSNEQWTLHSSDYSGNDSRIRMMANHIIQLFGEIPDCLDDFSLASQISQAEAFKYFIERIRLKQPRAGGIIWWNLLDGWPQVSDAVVDYYFDKKLAFDYIKTSQQPFCMMVDELKDWCYCVWAANDTLNTVEGTYEITDLESGESLAHSSFKARPNENTRIGSIRLYYSEKRILLIHWSIDGRDYYNHYLCGMPPFSFDKYRELLGKLREL